MERFDCTSIYLKISFEKSFVKHTGNWKFLNIADNV